MTNFQRLFPESLKKKLSNTVRSKKELAIEVRKLQNSLARQDRVREERYQRLHNQHSKLQKRVRNGTSETETETETELLDRIRQLELKLETAMAKENDVRKAVVKLKQELKDANRCQCHKTFFLCHRQRGPMS